MLARSINVGVAFVGFGSKACENSKGVHGFAKFRGLRYGLAEREKSHSLPSRLPSIRPLSTFSGSSPQRLSVADRSESGSSESLPSLAEPTTSFCPRHKGRCSARAPATAADLNEHYSGSPSKRPPSTNLFASSGTHISRIQRTRNCGSSSNPRSARGRASSGRPASASAVA